VQPVDFTTLMAVCHDLRTHWVPSRCEQVVQVDTTAISMALRTLDHRAWLTISWHPQAARLHFGDAPPKGQTLLPLASSLNISSISWRWLPLTR
jgi:predicted ribosome quality control (RQC) complex YloA/Tae2 family protein